MSGTALAPSCSIAVDQYKTAYKADIVMPFAQRFDVLNSLPEVTQLLSKRSI